MGPLESAFVAEDVLKEACTFVQNNMFTVANVATGEKGAKQPTREAAVTTREKTVNIAHIITKGRTKRQLCFLIPTNRRMVQSISKSKTLI